jgi:uncharacterized protein YbjQ (UPF0145 family)
MNMKAKLRIGIISILCASLVACANVGVQRIGQSSYSPLSDTDNVFVFTSESQIKDQYEVIGIISYNNPGKYQVLTLESAMEPLKEKARQLGANAIVIDKSQPVKSGIISTGIYVEARAIRIKFNSQK